MTFVEAPCGLGRHVIVRETGRGGTADVCLARRADLDQQFALEELCDSNAVNAAFGQRCVRLRDADVAGSSGEANLVTLYEDVGESAIAIIGIEHFVERSLRLSNGGRSPEQMAARPDHAPGAMVRPRTGLNAREAIAMFRA